MLFFLNLFLACSSTTEKQAPSQEVEEVVAEPSQATTTETQTETASETETPPGLETESLGEGLYPAEEAPYRNKKRMGVSQIRTSMVLVSGGIEWVEENQEKWDKYSATLGVPDYQQRVREDRSASVMFQKFLDDAAVHTCTQWVALESNGEQRLFFAEIEPDEDDPAKTLQNIAHLRQRIHGTSFDPTHSMVDALMVVHQLVMQRSGKLENAWTTVCVGLFTHPDFFMY